MIAIRGWFALNARLGNCCGRVVVAAADSLSNEPHRPDIQREKKRERESAYYSSSGCMRPMSRSGGSRCRCYHLSQKLIRRGAEPRELARGIC